MPVSVVDWLCEGRDGEGGRSGIRTHEPLAGLDPPPERSGVLGIGKAVLSELVAAGEVLTVTIGHEGIDLT
jgi:hypothetical protein